MQYTVCGMGDGQTDDDDEGRQTDDATPPRGTGTVQVLYVPVLYGYVVLLYISPGAQVYTGTGGSRHILAQVNLFSQYFYSFIVNMLFIHLKSRNIENI